MLVPTWQPPPTPPAPPMITTAPAQPPAPEVLPQMQSSGSQPPAPPAPPPGILVPLPKYGPLPGRSCPSIVPTVTHGTLPGRSCPSIVPAVTPCAQDHDRSRDHGRRAVPIEQANTSDSIQAPPDDLGSGALVLPIPVDDHTLEQVSADTEIDNDFSASRSPRRQPRRTAQTPAPEAATVVGTSPGRSCPSVVPMVPQ